MTQTILKRLGELIIRLKELYEVSHTINNLGRYNSISNKYNEIELPNLAKFFAWHLSVRTILDSVFKGTKHLAYFNNVPENYSVSDSKFFCRENLAYFKGILESCKEEIQLGFLNNVKQIISAEFFDDILEQAKELLKHEYKNPVAILGRIIIENTLKELCIKNNIVFDEDGGAQALNQKLKEENIFTLAQFKVCRTNIELGNYAAHGKFDKYDVADVKNMLEYIEIKLLII